jgi:hypothetical protein
MKLTPVASTTAVKGCGFLLVRISLISPTVVRTIIPSLVSTMKWVLASRSHGPRTNSGQVLCRTIVPASVLSRLTELLLLRRIEHAGGSEHTPITTLTSTQRPSGPEMVPQMTQLLKWGLVTRLAGGVTTSTTLAPGCSPASCSVDGLQLAIPARLINCPTHAPPPGCFTSL